MPTKTRNFWVLLTLFALLLTGTRWLSRQQPQEMRCHSLKLIEVAPYQQDCDRPARAYPYHKKRCQSSRSIAYTPAFNEFVRVDREPRPLNQFAVKLKTGYPDYLRDAGVRGTATARILVGEHGQYLRHQVIHLSHPALHALCDRQAEQLEFTPAMRDGQPVRYWVNVPFTFGE